MSTDLEEFFEASDDEAVVAAYAGEFLPEDVYDDWTAGTRDEARSRFLAAVRRLAERAAQDGDHGRAALLARRLIGVDRYDESAHRMLVVELQRSGEVGEARRAHQAWEAALGEIGVDVDGFEDVVGS